jgi:hypothetical protein
MVINLKNFSLNSVNEKYVERRIPNSMIHTAEGLFSSLYRRVVKFTPPINGENCVEIKWVSSHKLTCPIQ